MDTKYAYVFVTVLAAFALGALAFAPTVEATDHNGLNTYTMYVEVVESNGTVSGQVTVTFVSAPNNAAFAKAATDAFAAKGFPLVVAESSYGITMNYNDDLNIACWVADGDQWSIVSDTSYQYVESSVIGLAVKTGFISEDVYKNIPAAEKSKWVENPWGAGTEWAYMKCPDVSPSDIKDSCLANMIEPLMCNIASGFKAFA